MKYRVKFNCYWYNTGLADNHTYENYEDFDTIEMAELFKQIVDFQFKIEKNIPDIIIRQEYFEKEGIEIENGFITSEAKIVKFFPEKEEAI